MTSSSSSLSEHATSLSLDTFYAFRANDLLKVMHLKVVEARAFKMFSASQIQDVSLVAIMETMLFMLTIKQSARPMLASQRLDASEWAEPYTDSYQEGKPGGKLSLCINQEGTDYYNNLIDELLANGIEPYVTLWHLDTPNVLQGEYMGFLSEKIICDFVNYAKLCFWEFGDRVKHWITLNELQSYCVDGHGRGSVAPGRGGVVILVPVLKLGTKFLEPLNAELQDDIDAALRGLDFMFGW
ncbi:beta-glucosidase 24-like protein [Tanacetum coccineum]